MGDDDAAGVPGQGLRARRPAAAGSGGHGLLRRAARAVRDIRASEKRFYQKVRELFAASSADYDGTSGTARVFFATIQNTLVFAITGRTAAGLVLDRADPSSPTLGLTTGEGPRIRKGDAVVAKNYLQEKELAALNRLTTRFLDFAEDRAERRSAILMAEWVTQTDRFLAFDERAVLDGPGTVSAERMRVEAPGRYASDDEHRRLREAEDAAAEEAGDIGALLSWSSAAGTRDFRAGKSRAAERRRLAGPCDPPVGETPRRPERRM